MVDRRCMARMDFPEFTPDTGPLRPLPLCGRPVFAIRRYQPQRGCSVSLIPPAAKCRCTGQRGITLDRRLQCQIVAQAVMFG